MGDAGVQKGQVVSNDDVLEIELVVDLNRSADAVWDVVGNFNGLPDWHPWVHSSVLEPAAGGIGRQVTIRGGSAGHRALTERLVSFDSAGREYAYTIIAGPTPFTDYVGRFRVVQTGTARCRVEYRGRYRARAGHSEADATERIRTFYEAALANLPVLFGP
jgi:hypothetical protein